MNPTKQAYEEIASIIIAIAIYSIIFIPYLFGLGYSFHRFGVIEGLVSFAVPPYAWYRGISYLWTEPKWKEDYDTNTEAIALIILSNDPLDRTSEIQFLRMKPEIMEWIKHLPKNEKQKLRKEMEALGKAYLGHEKQLLEALIANPQTSTSQLCAAPAIQDQIALFNSEPGISNAWRKITAYSNQASELTRQALKTNPEQKETIAALLQQREPIITSILEKGINERIRELFDN